MITGEIRVGDRLIRWRSDWQFYEPFRVAEIYKGEAFRLESESGSCWRVDIVLRKDFSRDRNSLGADLGWTRITPETLPEEDVKKILVVTACGAIVSITRDTHAHRWACLAHDRSYSYVAWRPIPPDWLPIPKELESP